MRVLGPAPRLRAVILPTLGAARRIDQPGDDFPAKAASSWPAAAHHGCRALQAPAGIH